MFSKTYGSFGVEFIGYFPLICFLCRHSSRLSKWITHCLSGGTHHKSESKSSVCRNKGNNKYKVHDDEGSLELYTESVRRNLAGLDFPTSVAAYLVSLELRLGTDGKDPRASMCFECLRDIELALKNDYPQHLRHKLETRRGQCLARLQHRNKSQHVTEMSQKDIKYVTENKKICSQKEVGAHLHEACSTDTSSRECEDNLAKREHYVELPSVVHGEHDKFPFASSALDLVYAHTSIDWGIGELTHPRRLLILFEPVESETVNSALRKQRGRCLNKDIAAPV
uniref:Uncharacterized protein n=1 Tax=Timema poppense TaxID=170557 RepID=A0A7R9DAH5_TIMPO|nr:unnamed protein product [Timema poppensis]